MITNKLQTIANILQFDVGTPTPIGIFNGKMGAAIFFYRYAALINSQYYHDLAGEILDEIFEQIGSVQFTDFEDGLAGIGWGIDYIIKNNFADAEPDDVLDDVDQIIKKGLLQGLVTIKNRDQLYGSGLYFSSRLGDADNFRDVKTLHNIKLFLIYLHDDCERQLQNDKIFEIPLPELRLNQLNSIIYFVIKMGEAQLYPQKAKKMVADILKYIERSEYTYSNDGDSRSHFKLLWVLNTQMSCKGETDLSIKILDLLKKMECTQIRDQPALNFGQLSNFGWNSLLYSPLISFEEDHEQLRSQIHLLFQDEYTSLKIFDGDKRDIVGLGLALINCSY